MGATAYSAAVSSAMALLRSQGKLTQSQAEEIEALFAQNIDGIAEAQTFVGSKAKKRAAFVNILQNGSDVKASAARRLYGAIFKELRVAAQTAQFGEFLSGFDAVDADYHHILKWRF